MNHILYRRGVNFIGARELVVKGANVTCGYWQRPEATLDAFDDGWFRTGDIARINDAGYLWLVDRKKDMFISGGENVYPAEVEGALAAHALIAECAVIGVADDRWGEGGHLAKYKIPKHLSVMRELARNGAGRLMKSTLRALLKSSDS